MAAPASDKVSLSEVIEKYDWTRSRYSVEDFAHRLEIPTMETQLSKHNEVYYVSYGSNLKYERFLVYLRGGTPEGSDRLFLPNPGGTELPKDDVFFTSEYWAITFAGRSQTWSGGMAFLIRREGISPVPGPARFRAYRITLEQFVGVVRLENTSRDEMKAGVSEVPELQAVLDGGDLNLSPGQHLNLPSLDRKKSNYPRLVWLGMLEDLPVLTFTCSKL